jgi:hypothetical protein
LDDLTTGPEVEQAPAELNDLTERIKERRRDGGPGADFLAAQEEAIGGVYDTVRAIAAEAGDQRSSAQNWINGQGAPRASMALRLISDKRVTGRIREGKLQFDQRNARRGLTAWGLEFDPDPDSTSCVRRIDGIEEADSEG